VAGRPSVGCASPPRPLTTTRPRLGGTAVCLLALTAVSGCGGGDHSNEIDRARDGRVDGLVVLDNSFDRWFVPSVNNVELSDDRSTLSFSYYTATCSGDGLVGYALEPTAMGTRLTVVAGESSSGCGSVAREHHADIPLPEPLPTGHVVVVKPMPE
jgi:hypothetical protein